MRFVRSLPVRFAVAVVIVIAAVVLVLLGPGSSAAPRPRQLQEIIPDASLVGSGQLSSSQRQQLRLRQQLQYIYRAEAVAWRGDQSCELIPAQRRAASVSEGAPPARLLSMLAVLRRPAMAADALPGHVTRPGLDGVLAQQVYLRDIRRARWRYGAGYYIIPAGDVNPVRSLPQSCYQKAAAQVRTELPTIPKALRAGVLQLESRVYATGRSQSRAYPGVCLAAYNSRGGGSSTCDISIADIEAGKAFADDSATGVTTLDGLVPDDVASVTLSFPAATITRRLGNKRERVDVPARAITVKAIDNIFILLQPRDGVGFPAEMIWRSAGGKPIKTVHGF